MQLLRLLSAVACIALTVLHSCFGCSPKAVKSVIIGRGAAQAQHQAQKAKYLAGETKTVGQKLHLSRGGLPMEQVGVKRLRSEIKYLESVQKALKKQKKRELKLAKAIEKSQVTGKPLSGAAFRLQHKKIEADLLSDQARGVQALAALKGNNPLAAGAGAAASAATKAKGGGKGVTDAADSLADAGKAAKDASKGSVSKAAGDLPTDSVSKAAASASKTSTGTKAATNAVEDVSGAVKPVDPKQFKGQSVQELADQMKSTQTRLDDASKALQDATEAHAKALEIAASARGLARIAARDTNKQRIQMAAEKMAVAKKQLDETAEQLAGLSAAHAAKVGKTKGAAVAAVEAADKAEKTKKKLFPWR